MRLSLGLPTCKDLRVLPCSLPAATLLDTHRRSPTLVGRVVGKGVLGTIYVELVRVPPEANPRGIIFKSSKYLSGTLTCNHNPYCW
jgi:hypothetical protein